MVYLRLRIIRPRIIFIMYNIHTDRYDIIILYYLWHGNDLRKGITKKDFVTIKLDIQNIPMKH